MPSCHKHSEASFYCDLILEILQTVKPEPFLKLELDMLCLRPPDLQSVPLQLSKGLRSDLPSQGPGSSDIEGFLGRWIFGPQKSVENPWFSVKTGHFYKTHWFHHKSDTSLRLVRIGSNVCSTWKQKWHADGKSTCWVMIKSNMS